MKPSNLLSRQLPLGTVLVAALALGACGGGGGSSGTPPAASPPAASPPVASLGCSNVQGSGNGYVMGVCVTSNGSTGGVFQNYTVGVDRSATGIKSYTATLGGSPTGAGTVTSSISGEECAANGIGNAFVYTTVSLDTAGATTGPQWIVQSVNETFAPNTPLLCKQTGASQLALRNPAYFPMTYLDGGMVERLATAAASPPVSTYLAGWVSSINSSGNAAPSANRSYTTGRTVARAVTQVAGAYGVDTAASATVTGSTITISLSNFSYRRDNADGTTAGIPSADHRLGSVTMTGTISGSTFSGTIVGSDVAGSAGAVTGTFEGRFGGPAGSEVAARYAIRFTGNSSVVAGAVFLK